MLTREQVLGMESGREMDELIEFNVMGTRRPAKGFVIIHKHYSEDISAAWEVVEEVAKSGRGVELGVYRVTNAVTIGLDTVHSDDSMPLAICKAALLTTIQE